MRPWDIFSRETPTMLVKTAPVILTKLTDERRGSFSSQSNGSLKVGASGMLVEEVHHNRDGE